MKKALLITALLLCGVARAASSVAGNGGSLYWVLDPVGDKFMFTYVRLAAQGATKEYLADDIGSTYFFGDNAPGRSDNLSTPHYAQLPEGAWNLSYYLELYDEFGNLIGTSMVSQYADFEESQSIYDDLSTGGVLEPYHFTVVPEPTGGLLVVIGMSVLALRRRRWSDEGSAS